MWIFTFSKEGKGETIMETNQELDIGKQGDTHWSQHPWKLLAAALAALLVANLIELVVAFALAPLTSNPSVWPVSALYNVIPPVLWLLLVAAFYDRVRAAQRKHGVEDKACWRPGAVFFIGLGLLLLAALLQCLPVGSQSFNILVIATDFLGFAAYGLALLLVFHLLTPSFDKKFGVLKGAWVLGAGFALLAVLERIGTNIIGGVYYGILYRLPNFSPPNALSFLSVNFTLGTLLPLCVTAFALTAVRIFLYQRASRRMPGAWMLFSAIPPLLGTALSAILRALPANKSVIKALAGNRNASLWLNPCVNLVYYLIIFAAGISLLAAFQHWKTFEAFWADAKVLIRRTQGDTEE